MTANQKLDSVLRYLNDVHAEPIDIKEGLTQNGGKWSSVSPLEFQKHWKEDLEIGKFAFPDKVEIKEVKLMLRYLLDENFIVSKPLPNHLQENQYSICFHGKMFIENGGYVERERRTKIDYTLKEKQLLKTSWDVSKMKLTFAMALLAFVFSIFTFFSGINFQKIIQLIQGY